MKAWAAVLIMSAFVGLLLWMIFNTFRHYWFLQWAM